MDLLYNSIEYKKYVTIKCEKINLRQYNNNKRKTFQTLLFQTNKKYMNAFMLLLVAVELVPNEIFNSIKKEKNSPFATDVEQRRNLNP